MDKIEHWFNVNYERLVNNTNRITRDKEKSFDILQECILSFLQQPVERQLEIYNGGKIEHYITKCINLQWKSSTSPYHRKHRRQGMMEVEYMEWQHLDVEADETDLWKEGCDCVEREIENLFWYHKILIKEKYYEAKTYAELHEKYKISKNSLLRDIKEAVAILKEKCNGESL